MKERKKIGVVGVDSAKLLITDPCYLESKTEKQEYDEEEMFELTRTEDQGGQLNYNMGHAGLGVVFRSGLGDGGYEVYATYDDVPGWGRRIIKVEVMLLSEEEIDILEGEKDG